MTVSLTRKACDRVIAYICTLPPETQVLTFRELAKDPRNHDALFHSNAFTRWCGVNVKLVDRMFRERDRTVWP